MSTPAWGRIRKDGSANHERGICFQDLLIKRVGNNPPCLRIVRNIEQERPAIAHLLLDSGAADAAIVRKLFGTDGMRRILGKDWDGIRDRLAAAGLPKGWRR